MNNMVDIQRSYAYLPKEMVGDTTKPEPTDLELNQIGKFPFTEFDVLGDTSPININTVDLDGSIKDAISKVFDVQKTDDGTLFVSKRSFTVDLQDREVPRALLITRKGNELMNDVPGILKMIDKGMLPERNPRTKVYGAKSVSYGWSGKVTVAELPNGKSVVVKRFNRYEKEKKTDGRRMAVGGLEVAKFKFALEKSEVGKLIRMPDIYFASQDILVMENIEDLTPANDILLKRSDLQNTIRAMTRWLYLVSKRVWNNLGLFGGLEGNKLEDNLYVDRAPLEIGKLKLVLLDPIREN